MAGRKVTRNKVNEMLKEQGKPPLPPGSTIPPEYISACTMANRSDVERDRKLKRTQRTLAKAKALLTDGKKGDLTLEEAKLILSVIARDPEETAQARINAAERLLEMTDGTGFQKTVIEVRLVPYKPDQLAADKAAFEARAAQV